MCPGSVGTRQALLQGWLLCVGFVYLANVPDLVRQVIYDDVNGPLPSKINTLYLELRAFPHIYEREEYLQQVMHPVND